MPRARPSSVKFYARVRVLQATIDAMVAPKWEDGGSFAHHQHVHEFHRLKKRLTREMETAYAEAGRLDLEKELGRPVTTFRKRRS